MKIIKQKARVLSNDRIADEIHSIWLENNAIAMLAKPGQFLNLYCREESRLLPRPISICEVDRARSALRIVFRIVGKGTGEFSTLPVGSLVEVMGPLGNGYSLQEGGQALLIAGGIGIPPLLELAKQLNGTKTIVLGFRSETFLAKEFEQYGTVYIASEDGSVGTKGNVLDAIRENKLSGDMIYACGPMPMLRGIKAFSEESQIPAQISLEERMACGIGACLGCVCKTKEKDSHTNVNNTRICTEGPVFYASEVEL